MRNRQADRYQQSGKQSRDRKREMVGEGCHQTDIQTEQKQTKKTNKQTNEQNKTKIRQRQPGRQTKQEKRIQGMAIYAYHRYCSSLLDLPSDVKFGVIYPQQLTSFPCARADE